MKLKKKQNRQHQWPDNEMHLGGHGFVSHIDLHLLKYFKDNLDCNSMVDIGCGTGGMIKEAQTLGYTVLGIDGDYRLEREDPSLFLLHDFTKGPIKINKEFDLGYSCEFVEHVREEYMQNYMEIFKNCKFVAMTFAPPGKKGHHHVNCQPETYWVKKFKELGFELDIDLTREIRDNSTMEREFVRRFGLCFRNTEFNNDNR